jgi:hypothetical protein
MVAVQSDGVQCGLFRDEYNAKNRQAERFHAW